MGEMYVGVEEVRVVEKIWAMIIEVVGVVCEVIGGEWDEVRMEIIENEKRLGGVREYGERG